MWSRRRNVGRGRTTTTQLLRLGCMSDDTPIDVILILDDTKETRCYVGCSRSAPSFAHSKLATTHLDPSNLLRLLFKLPLITLHRYSTHLPFLMSALSLASITLALLHPTAIHTTRRVVLAATLQEHSPFIISASLGMSTNIIQPPFMSSLLANFARSVFLVHTSKSANIWST